MRKKKSGNYDVGYAKPPKKTRFQPGKSGNPSGRPKGVRRFQQELDAILNEKITVTANGKSRRISILTALLKQLANNALKGDKHAQRTLFNQMTRRDINIVNAELARLEKEEKSINVYITRDDANL